ncbi:MAG: HAMP domain-containing histidine kinase [Planctomycetaceae bacterium]|nr:HAMP domain-containing histidine kinase [Planctomycetaceae bacterium]MCB9940867.1 HAMP domain-containing histidine kinase [Planctomycetaceae bacterium]
MAWNALVVIVTGVVMLVGLREGVRITLLHELDQLLAEDANEVELALRRYSSTDSKALREQLDRKALGHAQHQWFVQLSDAQAGVLYQSLHAPPDDELKKRQVSSATTVGNWRFVDRVVATPSMIRVRVGSSLEMLHADVARLDKLAVLATGIVLLTAPICGYWLAGRATRPLNQMIVTMSQLRPSRLDERLAIRETGDELDRLSLTFNRLLDRIGSYLQERRDSLANAAHELRTPLAAIRSSIEVALASGRTVDEYEGLLEEIIEEAGSLELLVNQLLLLSETEAEQLRVHKDYVRLDELIDKAMDMFGGVAEYREIQLNCPALPRVAVNGNCQHLRQVVYNLIDNALKFTPAGGQVRVRLTFEGEPPTTVRFAVEDTGLGIPAEELPRVFDRFFKGTNRRSGSAEVRGTGLGLSICQAVVRAHEGTIEADSEPGRRTCFTVRLPIVPLRSDDSHDDRRNLTMQRTS